MAGAFKSQAQAERCKKLVADGKMTQAAYDEYVRLSGGEVAIKKLPARVGK